MTAHPDKTFILFNPDLEMKGSPTGIRERDRRQRFLDSFASAYVYLSLCTLSRPALIPRELGALHFRFEEGRFRLLRCLLPVDGPGSLNRFFLGQKRVYETVRSFAAFDSMGALRCHPAHHHLITYRRQPRRPPRRARHGSTWCVRSCA